MDHLLWDEARVCQAGLPEKSLELWRLFQRIKAGEDPIEIAMDIVQRELLTPDELREWVFWLKSNRPQPLKNRPIDKIRKRGRY
tara:strand:- start:88 stop:339 length:252 start_codon:yes stop_codon:yes gene_type:complete